MAVRYDDTLQDFSVIIEGLNATFSDRQLACIAEMAESTFYFPYLTDGAARARFEGILEDARRQRTLSEARRWLQERGRLEYLPMFDARRHSLAEYARELEVFCGVEPGAGLSDYGGVALTPNLPSLSSPENYPLTVEQFTCLSNAITASNLHEHGIGFGFVGNKAHSYEGGEE